MATNEVLQDLTKAIISISDLNGNVVKYNNVEIKSYIDPKSPYDNDLNIGCFIDGKKLSVRDKKVTYRCKCGSINTIYLKKYIIKTRLVCVHCREKDEEKRKNHSLFFKTGIQKHTVERPPLQVYNFENESEFLKKNYYSKHFIKQEFFSYLPHIIKIDNIDIQDKEIDYLEHELVKNRSKYAPIVLINEQKHKFENVFVQCPQCGKIYKISDSRNKRDKFAGDLFCMDCKFANIKFPRLFYTTKFGDNISYQGKTELSFIQSCEKNNIRIIDGPVVPYYFGKWRRYFVDFELPELNKIIEIKGDHIWYKQTVENGKWPAKEAAARDYASKNSKQYYLLFLKYFKNFFINISEEIVKSS